MGTPIVLLMGPTASGKTELAVRLVERFPFEIISVDSALVYCGLNIGTAKPSPEILARFPHHLIDICDPGESYSAARFVQEAHQAIQVIESKGKIPLLVGGTGLYFRALQQGLSQLPAANPHIRARLLQEAQQRGWAALHSRLAAIDPAAAQRINPNDQQRIQRALEVFELTAQPMSTFFHQKTSYLAHQHVLKCILAPAHREILRSQIAQRFQAMLAAGLIDEVRLLFQRPDLNLHTPAIRSVGYRQVWHYLAGDWDYAQMVERAIIATRQLAKRQLTWLRAEPDAHWFDSQAPNLIQQVSTVICSFLTTTSEGKLR